MSTPRERRLTDYNFPIKKVELNDVFLVIKEYMGIIEKRLSGNELKDKTDAAWDIIALLHKAVTDGRL